MWSRRTCFLAILSLVSKKHVLSTSDPCIRQGSLNFLIREDQAMQIYGDFEGFPDFPYNSA